MNGKETMGVHFRDKGKMDGGSRDFSIGQTHMVIMNYARFKRIP